MKKTFKSKFPIIIILFAFYLLEKLIRMHYYQVAENHFILTYMSNIVSLGHKSQLDTFQGIPFFLLFQSSGKLQILSFPEIEWSLWVTDTVHHQHCNLSYNKSRSSAAF